MSVVIMSKIFQFSHKILSIPKEYVIKVFTANGSDESLNEGVR